VPGLQRCPAISLRHRSASSGSLAPTCPRARAIDACSAGSANVPSPDHRNKAGIDDALVGGNELQTVHTCCGYDGAVARIAQGRTESHNFICNLDR
jgi:hypothetical protein